jgi:exosome complex component RRP42
MDMKKLCIKKGEKVWNILVDIYPLNDEGNLFDAASLAAIAALKDAKFPEYDAKAECVIYTKRTKTSLPLKEIPIEVTVIKIKGKFLVDPTIDEWKYLDARLTVGTMENGTICAMQKGGSKSLSRDEIEKMIDIAAEHAKKLRKALEK